MKGQIFYSKGPNDKNVFNQLEKELHNLEVLFELKRMRIGLVGTPSDWLVASNPDPEKLEIKIKYTIIQGKSTNSPSIRMANTNFPTQESSNQNSRFLNDKRQYSP